MNFNLTLMWVIELLGLIDRLSLSWAITIFKFRPPPPPPTHLGTYLILNFTQSKLTVSELSLICVRSKLQRTSKQGSWPYSNEYQDAKPQSGTSSIRLSPKWRFKGHGCSLQLQNQDREPKIGSWVYHRPMTISKSRSRCQIPVRNLQRPQKPQMMT